MNEDLELKNEPVKSLFYKYLIPAVVGMSIMSLQIVIDGIFIGNGVGSNGLAAVNVSIPIFLVFIAISMLIGIGGATLVGQYFGEGDVKRANNIFSQSIIIAVLMSLGLTLILKLNIKNILIFMGASEIILPYATDYVSIMANFALTTILANVLINFARNDSAPNLSMYAMVLGAVTNGILDYIFIYKFDMALKGASIATSIGQMVALLVVLLHFLMKKGKLRMNMPIFNRSDILSIFKTGAPSFITEMSLAIVTFVFNIVLMKYLKEVGVATYSILEHSSSMILMVFMGISQAMQPIISYNYGAREYDRVKETYNISIKLVSIVGILACFVGLFLNKYIVMMFNKTDITLMKLATNAMRIYFVGFLFAGVSIVLATYFQSTDKSSISSTISAMRGLILVLAGLVLLPKVIGTIGIWLAVPIAEFITLIFAMVYKKRHVRYEKLL